LARKNLPEIVEYPDGSKNQRIGAEKTWELFLISLTGKTPDYFSFPASSNLFLTIPFLLFLSGFFF